MIQCDSSYVILIKIRDVFMKLEEINNFVYSVNPDFIQKNSMVK